MLCLGIVTARQKRYRERKFLFANGIDPSSARAPGGAILPPPISPGASVEELLFAGISAEWLCKG